MLFSLSERWKATFPDACIGVLILSGVINPERSPALDAHKQRLLAELRGQFEGRDRSALKAHPTIAAYAGYYKRFKKTYHVQLQLESIVFKSKSIPDVAALVEAMFMAELKNLLLTAGHDLDLINGTPSVNVAAGDEIYVRLQGGDQALKQGDMYIRDDIGILSSILYGPDQRTRITATTTRALFTVYGVSGIAAQDVHTHLEDLAQNARFISPDLEVGGLAVLSAS